MARQKSVPWDALDAAFRFLQGLGRLVRRKNLPAHRRIWVLDGRLAEPSARQTLSLFWSAIEKKRGQG
jgi:Rad3-related DNA helicase